MYVFNKRPDKAEGDLSKAIELSPMSSGLRVARGALYKEMGRLDDSVADLKKALELTPGQLAAMMLLARVESLRKDTSEACRWLNAAYGKGDVRNVRPVISEKDFDNIRESECYRKFVER